EPTAGLDPRGQRDIMQMFSELHHEKKVTTILVTHSMEDAIKYADHVIILNEGKKYMEGKPGEVFIHEDKLQNIHLNAPESILFLKRYMEKFNVTVPLTHQSLKDIAQLIHTHIQGGFSDE